jgi:hypothetical protein
MSETITSNPGSNSRRLQLLGPVRPWRRPPGERDRHPLRPTRAPRHRRGTKSPFRNWDTLSTPPTSSGRGAGARGVPGKGKAVWSSRVPGYCQPLSRGLVCSRRP